MNKCITLTALFVVLLCHFALAQSFDFTTIDFPSPKSGTILGQSATAINDAGKIVGAYTIQTRGNPYEESYIYEGGRFKLLKTLPFNAVVRGINNKDLLSGFVAIQKVRRSFSRFDGIHGFLEIHGKTILLDAPFADLTEAIGLNDSGAVVGDFRSSADEVFRGFIYDGLGSFRTLEFPGASLTAPNAINNVGQIVGFADNSTGRHGFLYDSGLFVQLDFPGAVMTAPSGINDAGLIVGIYANNIEGPLHGFVYDGFGFTTVDVPGAVFTDLVGVNNLGQIVGLYYDGSVSHGFLGTPRD